MRAGPDCDRKDVKFQSQIHKKMQYLVFLSSLNVLKRWEAIPIMLIISRKKDQKIVVADNIEITILEVGRNRVRFGVKAPKNIPIHTHLKGTEAEAVGAGRETPGDGRTLGRV